LKHGGFAAVSARTLDEEVTDLTGRARHRWTRVIRSPGNADIRGDLIADIVFILRSDPAGVCGAADLQAHRLGGTNRRARDRPHPDLPSSAMIASAISTTVLRELCARRRSRDVACASVSPYRTRKSWVAASI
jgi:hypothetical protein